ncbi:thioesterase domain-containing protein [Streptomyces sp. NPDC085932]|uniref:thioesterase domain-containing protein n=1 Tax=Streptomyces sp. NPDC085932 TaxID=3365741 RepID=UPI0037CF16AA
MTVNAGPFPLVLLPGPDTPAADVTRLVRALPAALGAVVLRPGADAAARDLTELADGLVRQVRDAGVTGRFALHGWGTGAHLGLALAGAFERAAGHAVCTTLFVSDAVAPGRAPAHGPLTQAVRRTVTESRLVVCAGPVPGRGLAPWSRHSTSGTEFVTLPPGPRPTALASLIATRLLSTTARAGEPSRVTGATP